MNLIKNANDLLEDQTEQHQAVLDYLRDSSWVNVGLRTNGGANHHPKQSSSTKAVDQVIAFSPPLKTEMTLYRAVPRDAFDDKNVGDEFVDRGFVSTSKTKEGSHHPGYVHRDDRMVLTIQVPPGTHALEVKKFILSSDIASQKAKELAEWEDEILLPRNLKFKILSKSKNSATIKVLR